MTLDRDIFDENLSLIVSRRTTRKMKNIGTFQFTFELDDRSMAVNGIKCTGCCGRILLN